MHLSPPPTIILNTRNSTVTHENQTQITFSDDFILADVGPHLVPELSESLWGATTPAPSLQERAYPDLHSCRTPLITVKPILRGSHWVLFNYVPADTQPACNESVTYSTHADRPFLDNLVPLVDRWRGPISSAVFAPGSDFNTTLEYINFLRVCYPLISKHVTFHVIFPINHLPKTIPSKVQKFFARPHCKSPPKFSIYKSYKWTNNLTYPVNVARNVARLAAATYFILASDVELYPSINFIPRFLEMMQRKDASKVPTPARRVYVLPIFEIKSGLRPPTNKSVLIKMLKRGSAIVFHKYVCYECHVVPDFQKWPKTNASSDQINVFFVAKRHTPHDHWEPIYVGTNMEPLYDERLTWEGRSDKMTQMYVMCILDYEFHVLDNAFLVHRPGIKRAKKDKRRDRYTVKQNLVLHSSITPELHVIYGKKSTCFL